MTLPTPLPPPPATLPPPPAPSGPSTWPRPPRWLGLGTVVRLAARELRDRRTSTVVAAVMGIVAGAVLAGALDADGRPSLRPLAAIVLLTLAAAFADATDPKQRDDAALLLRLGCPRTVIRIAAWATSVISLGIPAALSGWLTDVLKDQPSVGRTGVQALLLTAAGAATTAGTRLSAPATQSRTTATVRVVARTVIALLIILVGALGPASSRTGTDLDLSLTLGTFLVIVGLVILAPVLAMVATGTARRLPWPAARVAGATVAPQRRGLTVTVALISSVAAIVVVQGVLGEGLGAREQARVEALRTLGPATYAGSDHVVIVDRSLERIGELGPRGEEPDLADLTPEGAIGAGIETLPTEVAAVGGALGNASQSDGLFSFDHGSVAVASPELLAALGLDTALATGERALVLDRRVIDDENRVRLYPNTNPDDPTPDPVSKNRGVRVPATFVGSGAAWVGVPPVLLPQAVFDDLPREAKGTRPGDFPLSPTDAVIRFPERPTAAQVDALADVAGFGSVALGNDAVDLTASDRTDRMSSVWVRTAAETRQLALALGAMALIAIGVALLSMRLAVRREDAVLLVLGARRRTMALVSALRGASVALTATVAGAGIALLATRFGLSRYNGHGRFQSQVVLDPISWSVPPAVLALLVAVPLVAALLGAAVALLGPADRSAAGGTDGR